MHWLLVFQTLLVNPPHEGVWVPTFREFNSRGECETVRKRVVAQYRKGYAEAACFMLDAP